MRRYLILFLVIVASGCNKKNKKEEVKADIINYKVEYLHEKAGSVPTKILPDNMTVVFSYPYAVNNIEGFFGQFSLSYVANMKKKKVTTLLKLFDKKYVYTGETPCGIDPMNNMNLKPAAGVKTIAGFGCHEYILVRPGEPDMPVYSTSELEIRSPNITTPYQNHQDVLLQFYTRLSVLDMILVADSCKTEMVNRDIFRIPGDYKSIPKEKMEKVLDELFK